MEIKKLFEQDSTKTSEGIRQKKISAYQGQAAENNASVQNPEDRVSISPLYHQLAQISKIMEEDQAEQNKRVADIKAQVAAGTYKMPSSESVARSLVSFANDTKDLA